MNADRLSALHIDRSQKKRPQAMFWTIVIAVAVLTVAALFMARPRPEDKIRLLKPGAGAATNVSAQSPAPSTTLTEQSNSEANSASKDDAVLTVSGYIINRERIEISPRFLGVVRWIGVKKGDAVTNGQVVVLLDDAEYEARLAEADGRLAAARTAVSKAELDLERINKLASTDVESKQAQDDARLQLDSARAALKEIEGARELAKTYLDWCVIRSPIDGLVLEKLVNPNELVMPQSFGGARGPSTAFMAVADPKDLQVEIDVNESDLSKIRMGQKCRVSPEAYPDKTYEGVVAEIAPEANRSKGTLQIKVQIMAPDGYLTPELSAKVDFLR